MSIYYVIESEYVGPNTQGRIDSHLVTITTDAPRTNLSHEVRLDGWIGTTNDTSRHAHGAYTSEDEAREAVAELFGPCRESDEIDDPEMITMPARPDDASLVEAAGGRVVVVAGEAGNVKLTSVEDLDTVQRLIGGA